MRFNRYAYLCITRWKFTCRLSGASFVTSKALVNVLHLYSSPTTSFISYTDADWSGFPDIRRSTSSYCVFLGDNLLSWSSKGQATLSRSSVETEHRGVVNVVSESCWLCNFLLELNGWIKKGPLVHCNPLFFFGLKKSSNPSIKYYVHPIHPLLYFIGWIIHLIHKSKDIILFEEVYYLLKCFIY